MYLKKILILKFWKYLSNKRKKQLFFTFIVSIISGISEIVTINAALPFISALTGNKNFDNYPISLILSKILNIPVNEEIIIPIIIFFGLNIIISTFLRLFNIWIINYTSALVGIDLSVKSLSNTIYQPYSFHINNNSSTVVTSNTLYIDRTITALINSLLFVSNLILALTIGGAMFFITPNLAISSLISIAFIYFLIAKKLNKIVKINGIKIASSIKSKVKSLQEVIGSIRSVLLESNQEIYIKEIKRLDYITRIYSAKNTFIAEFPRYVIECLALLIISLISLFILKINNGNIDNSFIVILGSFTLAIQRLLPVIQRLYSAWINMNAVHRETENIYKIIQLKIENNINRKIIPIKFKKSIKLESIFFSYKGNRNIISNIDLEIFKGQKIGIIGKTGSGKSTLVDLIMGLIKPTSGKIYIDGKDLHDNNPSNNLQKWMNSISHVPQDIFLMDGTISQNIAFGKKNKHNSMRQVIQASKKAQLHEFIKSTPNGYETFVGERGIKLSGGQRQRIGIARALYNESEILILDEATSALDNETENSLMNCINEISNEITIISIAHRHSTLKNFDRVIKIDNGFLLSEGNPKEFLKS